MVGADVLLQFTFSSAKVYFQHIAYSQHRSTPNLHLHQHLQVDVLRRVDQHEGHGHHRHRLPARLHRRHHQLGPRLPLQGLGGGGALRGGQTHVLSPQSSVLSPDISPVLSPVLQGVFFNSPPLNLAKS